MKRFPRVLSQFVFLTVAVTLFVGCGDEPGETDGCTAHTDCPDGEACFDDICVETPSEGDSCPDARQGESFDNLICEDGTWQVDDQQRAASRLSLKSPPPSQAVAGTPFDVDVAIVDEEGVPVAAGGIAVTIGLDDGEFADGTDEKTLSTDSEGVARFELTLEKSVRNRILTATSDWGELDVSSVQSDPFDVVAADASPDNSSIRGEDGVAADGNEHADIEIELFDRFDNPVVDVVPEFQASGDGNEYGDCSSTNSLGVATCTMTSTQPGEKTLEITDPVEVVGETIEFVSPCDPESSPFGGGDGTASSPWMICTPEHLDAIGAADLFVGDHILLYDGIDMSDVEDFSLIGDEDDPFVGSFDGGGHTISNLTIDADDDDHVGPFGYIAETGLVENVTFEALNITGDDIVGGVAGFSGGTIADVTVTGSVDGSNHVGGFVGISGEESTIQNAVADSDVYALYGTVGGFVAVNRGTISDSRAEGEVLYYNGGYLEGTGGFAGVSFSGSVIERSSATGLVNGEEPDFPTGGFVGLVMNDAEITESYSTGEVRNYLGGRIGGFAGELRGGIVADCYTTGFVQTPEGGGGFVGHADNEASISNAYASGALSSVADSGGFAALLTSSVAVNASYWDQTASISDAVGAGETDIDGVTGLETDEFSDEEQFDFDFDDIWEIGEAPDGETRPVLQWEP